MTMPTKDIVCFNCGCTVQPGECHCGATNKWAFDPFDGWWVTGSIAHGGIRRGELTIFASGSNVGKSTVHNDLD